MRQRKGGTEELGEPKNKGKNKASKDHGKDDEERSDKFSAVFLAQLLLIAAVAMSCYVNSLNGEMLMDDTFAVVKNMDLRPSTPISNLVKNDMWGLDVKHPASHKSYRPLTILTFRYNFAHSELDPYGYHLGNVILHGCASVIFTMVCRAVVFHDSMAARASGLLFATHPVHTDAVSSIVGRADVLSGMFFALTSLMYANAYQTKDSGWRGYLSDFFWVSLAYCFALCALFSKEPGFMALPLCLVCDVLHTACGNDPKHVFSGMLKIVSGSHRSGVRFMLRIGVVLAGHVRGVWCMTAGGGRGGAHGRRRRGAD